MLEIWSWVSFNIKIVSELLWSFCLYIWDKFKGPNVVISLQVTLNLKHMFPFVDHALLLRRHHLDGPSTFSQPQHGIVGQQTYNKTTCYTLWLTLISKVNSQLKLVNTSVFCFVLFTRRKYSKTSSNQLISSHDPLISSHALNQLTWPLNQLTWHISKMKNTIKATGFRI